MDVRLTHGKSLKQPEGAISASDDQRLTVSSKGEGLSNYLDFYIEMSVDQKKRHLEIELEAMSENPGGFEIYLLNWDHTAFEKIGVVSLNRRDQKLSVAVNDAERYVNTDKRIRVRFYRKERLWNGFDLGIDAITAKGTDGIPSDSAQKKPATSLTPPISSPEKEGKKEDESLGSKAKKAWEKLRKRRD